jgi:hypothetical protein
VNCASRLKNKNSAKSGTKVLQQVERHKRPGRKKFHTVFGWICFVGLAYQGKDVVFRLVIEL